MKNDFWREILGNTIKSKFAKVNVTTFLASRLRKFISSSPQKLTNTELRKANLSEQILDFEIN